MASPAALGAIGRTTPRRPCADALEAGICTHATTITVEVPDTWDVCR